MGRKKKTDIIETEQVKKPKKVKEIKYKTFEELSQKNQLVILKYEEKVSKIYGRRKQNYTMNEIKKIYKGCTIPPFTLETMKLVIENE